MAQTENPWSLLGPEGLQLSGRITAQATHEIKNCLAIIHENAGLTGDLIAMAERRGEPLDPARLAKLAMRIDEQVERANGVVQNLNRFAHLPDAPLAELDMAEHVALACALHRRPAVLAQVALEPGPAEGRLQSDPQLFHALVSRALRRALAAPGPDKRLTLSARPDGAGGVEVRVVGLDPAADHPAPDAAEQALRDALGAEWRVAGGDIIINVHPLAAPARA
ncbi:MAG: sensor histidine kinase [Desulfovibrionaceae bacterium]